MMATHRYYHLAARQVFMSLQQLKLRFACGLSQVLIGTNLINIGTGRSIDVITMLQNGK